MNANIASVDSTTLLRQIEKTVAALPLTSVRLPDAGERPAGLLLLRQNLSLEDYLGLHVSLRSFFATAVSTTDPECHHEAVPTAESLQIDKGSCQVTVEERALLYRGVSA